MMLPPKRPAEAAHPAPAISRRRLLGAVALPLLVGGCSSRTPLPLLTTPPGDVAAAARLQASAEAHGLAAYRRLNDINIAYAGQWRPLIGRIQPDIVDPGFRGGSQERLLPQQGVMAQAYTGPGGRKQVNWQRADPASGTVDARGDVAVWFNGVRNTEPTRDDAAALVAEAYGLFLLGPLWLVDRQLPMRLADDEQVDGRACEVVDVWLRPGLGRVDSDRVSVCIDRRDRLTRRLRFTLEGTANSRGAVAEVDTYDHAEHFGIVWPMRSHERVVHPIRLAAHDWHIAGLDVNRGYGRGALIGPAFSCKAVDPAKSIQG